VSSFVVNGGRRLEGTLIVSGAKNAVLPILAATLLLDRPVCLLNCPHLADVDNMMEILRTLGCKAQWEGEALVVDASKADCCCMPERLSKELRSSIFLLGPLLARFGCAIAAYPGGCEIGMRPIDLHLFGLRALHAGIQEEYGRICCDGKNLQGATIHLDYPSVGATENIMMAAVAAKGETVITNAAREPEIIDLQQFLVQAGFSVSGAGTSQIRIRGRKCACKDVTYRIMPDRIAAGTYLCAAAMTGGEIVLQQAAPEDMDSILAKLRESGCRVETCRDKIWLRANGPLREISRLETLPHPGFPTDMQAPIFALCTVAQGTSVIIENVFENRFKHAAELARMGAVSTIRDRTAVIRGVPRLSGAQVQAWDLRGGAALVLAGLCAQGKTVVHGAEYIDRGYEKMEEQLKKLGADITRQTEK